jgi:glycine betaine catabolism B
MKVTFVRKEEIAENIISFYFNPGRPVHYTAGQFIELYLPHANPDRRGTKRWFTLSSSPHEELLAITTNFSPENGSTFKKALRPLEPGTKLDMASPMGDFVLPKDPSIPLVFVAGGIGCTPFRSILTELGLTKEERDITLLYAAQKLEKVAFRELFETLGDKFKVILTDPPARWSGPTGHLSGKSILELTQPSEDHYIYVSGPEPMVESLSKDLKKEGVHKRHIFGDFFPGYKPI